MNKQTQTFIDLVETFRKVTGLPMNSKEPNIITHRKVIMEEYSEVADALADTIVTCLGLYLDSSNEDTKNAMLSKVQSAIKAAAIMDVDINHVMDKVQSANLSKICTSMDVAKKTKSHYHSIGVEAYIRDVEGGFFAVFSSENQTDKSGKEYPAHKLLKSVDWFEPNYGDFIYWCHDDEFMSHLNI